MHNWIRLTLLTTVLTLPALAQVQVASVFSDHMVLQRDKPIAVWGTAAAGEQLAVSIGEHKASPVAGSDGRWLVRMPAMAAGGPVELRVKGTNEVVIKDVLLGDVWICSGQSNMHWAMSRSKDTKGLSDTVDDAKLRLLQVPMKANRELQTSVNAKWTHVTPKSLPGFSAVAYGFGRHLRTTLDVPIGLLHTSWGGTRAEAWTREATLAKHEELTPILDRWAQTYQRYPEAKARHDKAMKQWQAKAKAAKEAGAKPPRRPGAPLDPDHRHAPGRLYNAMIAPLVPLAFKGVIWYQGESNAARAYQYRTLFPAMIRDWRDAFGQGQLPFLFVQLAAFEDKRTKPQVWAELREAQAMTLSLPNTGMACTIDLGLKNNIHPPHKLEVGRRLALWALADTYGQDVVPSGPMFSHFTVEGSRIRLHFNHVGSGLVKKGDELVGFEIASRDGKFVSATAEIDGNTVLVRGEVSEPRHVRYAWRHWPQISLFNGEGLPAVPFRTDDRKGVTADVR
jgi:sialate O-acetylesterase